MDLAPDARPFIREISVPDPEVVIVGERSWLEYKEYNSVNTDTEAFFFFFFFF